VFAVFAVFVSAGDPSVSRRAPPKDARPWPSPPSARAGRGRRCHLPALGAVWTSATS